MELHLTSRIAPWVNELPADLTAEQGAQLARDRIAWREQGYPDPHDFEGWNDEATLDYLVSRPSHDTLDLSGLKLAQFPDGLEGLEGIDCLFLMCNAIRAIPDAFLEHAAPLSLHLFDNAIEEVPSGIFMLKRMEELYLGRNPIGRIETPERENLVLKILLFDQCPGIHIQDSFFGRFPNLKSVALNGSDIEEIPVSIFSLTGLKQLGLENNPLKRLPDEIGQLSTLTQLDISDCQLESLPKSLSRMTGLRDIMSRTSLDSFGIRLSGNPFKDKDLRKIAKLENPRRTMETLEWAAANGA